jgi:hypothetical protein
MNTEKTQSEAEIQPSCLGAVIARFTESVGKIVEMKYKNSMDNIIERKGRLEKDLDWYYLYDEGKLGNQFNIAIQEKDLDRVVFLNVL